VGDPVINSGDFKTNQRFETLAVDFARLFHIGTPAST